MPLHVNEGAAYMGGAQVVLVVVLNKAKRYSQHVVDVVHFSRCGQGFAGTTTCATDDTILKHHIDGIHNKEGHTRGAR